MTGRTRLATAPVGIALLAGLAVVAGCAAPTPVYLGNPVPAAPSAPTTMAAAPSTQPLLPSTPPTVAALPPVMVLPVPTTGAPLPPVPVTYSPPLSTPEPVLPPVVLPTAAPTGRFAADLETATADAQRVVDGFWARHWGEVFSGSYLPPAVVGLYDGTRPDAPTCGSTPLPAFNAVYCVPQDYLAWDVTLLGLRTQIGDTWPYLVVAHEWAHAIQARLAVTLTTQALELQADCLAGATLYGAVADGTLVLGENAPTEIATALAAAADETPWTDGADHGNAAERTGAFDTGRTGGVRACLPPG